MTEALPGPEKYKQGRNGSGGEGQGPDLAAVTTRWGTSKISREGNKSNSRIMTWTSRQQTFLCSGTCWEESSGHPGE